MIQEREFVIFLAKNNLREKLKNFLNINDRMFSKWINHTSMIPQKIKLEIVTFLGLESRKILLPVESDIEVVYNKKIRGAKYVTIRIYESKELKYKVILKKTDPIKSLRAIYPKNKYRWEFTDSNIGL